LRKENILLLFGADSTLEWGRSYQIAKAFASLGHTVSYIDLPCPLKQGMGHSNTGGAVQIFSTFQPVCGLPCAKFPWLRWINYLSIKSQVISHLHKIGFKPTIIWAYAPYEPMVARYLRNAYNPELVVYDIADERIALAETQSGVKASKITEKYEKEIARYCDAVVTITESLKNTKRHLHENIVVMPNGIDMEMFDNNAKYAKPSYLESLSGKIVLYIGAIEEWVDIEAIRMAACTCPDAQFVLVGPSRIDISTLTKLTNVHIIGSRPYAEMPACIAHADVCILPFKDNEITRNSDPLKLLQYLSMGKHVVALYFKGINSFGGAVTVASGHEEFSAMIRQAGNATNEVASNIREYDWKHLVPHVLQQIKTPKG